MSYLTYWRLSRSPFSLRHPTRDFFVSGAIADAIARVDFLVQHGRRLGLLFGPRGVGKSSFFNYLVERCARFPKQFAGIVDFAGTNPGLLAKRFRDVLRGEPTPESWSMPNRFAETSSLGRTIHEIDELILANNTLGRQPILLLDNLDQADEDVFQTLSILLKRPGIWSAIVSVDESQLVEIPRKLLEECEVRVDLPAWDLGLTAEYLENALAKGGARDDVFTAQGITRLHELGDGVPKRMFQLADGALAIAAEKGVETVDADLIDQVCEDFSFGLLPREIPTFAFANR